jgi:hypothetical protein
MLETIRLPKDKKALARIIDEHADRERRHIAWRRALWLVAYYYLLGARHFDVFDPDSGQVHFSWLGDDDKWEYQSTELLSAVDRISGRLASVDMAPLVTRQGNSLQQIRQRAVAQVIANGMINPQQLEGIKTELSHLFTLLGSCGLIGHVTDHPVIGLTGDLQVIHPQELMPFPSLGRDFTKAMGIMWERVVPVDFLKERFGRRISDNMEDMEVWTAQIGQELDQDEKTPFGGAGLVLPEEQRGSISTATQSTEMDVARVRELWVNDPGGMCSRYVVASGDYVIEDVDTRGLEVYCPVGFGRFMENGTFWGSGAFDLLFPMAREAEQMARSLFKNIKDLDRYGVLVLPHGSFKGNTMLRDVGRGLRVFPWEPDPLAEGFRPFSITPFNMGDTPGRVAQFALDQIDRVNPLQDLVREKGRVDSAVGLSFLDEQINRAMTTPSRGIQKIFGECYRALVGNATREVMLSPRAIPVGHLTIDLAGAVIDPDTLEVTFRNNPLPNISKLSFGVKQTHPRSEVARKQEAIQLQQLFGIDPDTFLLFAMKEGLDFAMWSDEHQSAYEMIVRNIIFLYGDGQSPGKIVVVPQMSKPELQLRVLNSFMGGPIMAASTVQVQNEFIVYHKTLMEFMGLVLPAAVPNPDDLALLNRIDQQAAASPAAQPTPQGVVQ